MVAVMNKYLVPQDELMPISAADFMQAGWVKVVKAEDYDTLRTANQRLEGEVKRLREALNTAMNSMLDSGYRSGSVVIQKCKAALAGDGGEV